MTGSQINAAVFLLLMALAACFGAYGWLLRVPDGAARFRARCLADGILAAGLCWGATAVEDSLWWRILNYAVAAVALTQARAWWRKWEAARRFEREYAKHLRRLG